eukprot:CAMPEP_0176424840 /NCGR_PEP_ID=MMETSP0127-20121128/11059_1 /TAXON_ID=938130 /ORGANISM="Platyophrya macrostoma, Strain WH" /LENGTH=551 /DNA_ID=CAMNT_0017805939 /DNA_START=100 /DNA_END=1755 /DNA_ORIENTATION=+
MSNANVAQYKDARMMPIQKPVPNYYPQQQQQQYYPQPNLVVKPNVKDIVEPVPKSKIQDLPDTYDDDEELVPEQDQVIPDNKMQEEEMDVSTKINLSLKLNHKILQMNSASPQTHPMLLSLAVDEIKTNRKANLDLICVIDHSGSMEGEKLKLLKNTFEYLLTLLTDNDRLCLIIFDHQAMRLTRLIRMTEKGKKISMNKIKSITADGGTDINLGMQHAFKVIKDRRWKNPVTGVFLLSDGLDTNAQYKVKQTLEYYKLKDNFTINSFGYGNDHSPELMNDVAKIKEGAFYYVEKLDQVDECFVDCLGGLLSVIAEDVKIEIKAEPSGIFPKVEITKAYGSEGMWTIDPETKTYSTRIEQLISGKKKDYMLMLKIPSSSKELLDHEKNIVLATATCELRSALKQSDIPVVKKCELAVTFFNEAEDFKDNETDKEVYLNYYRVRGAEALDTARRLSDAKEFNEAKKLLTDFKEELSNSALKNEKEVKGLIEEFTAALENIKPEVYEIKGKHTMIQKARVHMEQQSIPMQMGQFSYANSMQTEMVRKAQARKK